MGVTLFVSPSLTARNNTTPRYSPSDSRMESPVYVRVYNVQQNWEETNVMNIGGGSPAAADL